MVFLSVLIVGDISGILAAASAAYFLISGAPIKTGEE
jgi:hypothetical protein